MYRKAYRSKPKRFDEMNGLERKYSAVLELRKLGGEIVDWKYQPIKLMLAKATSYTPDFFVDTGEILEFHETKGFMRDDANVKLKTVADLFPMFRFLLVEYKKGWVIKEV